MVPKKKGRTIGLEMLRKKNFILVMGSKKKLSLSLKEASFCWLPLDNR